TQRNSAMADVNANIAAAAYAHPNVVIVDWRAMTYANPSLLNSDGIHPTERGRKQLVAAIAAALGGAPTAPPDGDCLDSVFFDDGEGFPDGVMPTTTVTGTGTKPKPSPTSTTVSKGGGSSTTNPATATSTTVRSTTTTDPTTTSTSSSTTVAPTAPSSSTSTLAPG
ncbi:MAG: hypothetical protein WD023_02110, partial [Ilumatobacteraceae bacterium]